MPKRKPDHQPQRSCAVCRAVHPKRSMTRIVRQPDGALALDPSGRAPGRGTYLCDDAACHEVTRLGDGVRRALGSSTGLDILIGEITHAPA
ncbi:MAG: YlxR family protein [Gemmatimonadales bacterium]